MPATLDRPTTAPSTPSPIGPTGRPRRCCSRCGLVVLGPLTVLEISRVSHRAPECHRWVLCGTCGDSIRNYLAAGPALLERLELTTPD